MLFLVCLFTGYGIIRYMNRVVATQEFPHHEYEEVIVVIEPSYIDSDSEKHSIEVPEIDEPKMGFMKKGGRVKKRKK